MAFATVLSVAQTIFAGLECPELRKICSLLGYKADLEKLQNTVETIKAVLLDAAANENQLTHEALLYINRLEDAVYDADDLIDKFVTLARQKKLTKGNKVRLLPLFKELGVAYEMAHGVKKIRENLASISDDHKTFGLSTDPHVHRVTRTKRVETGSSSSDDIIGRDEDVDHIRGMLLDSGVQRDVSFLTVVGMGGLGKTALAQFLYNNKNVKDEFSLRAWACVADQDSGRLDVDTILHNILASATSEKHERYTSDVIQSKVGELLLNKKFLLVLDDVWTENRNEWLNLEGYLKGGKEGSWVLVTTRSTITAKVVGTGLMYELKGLSVENSWSLFERIAFQKVVKDANPPNELVNIGQEIIKMCANVPLAIRVVGALLFDQPKSKWERVLEMGLANINHEKNGIMPILKLSYDNLEAQMKICFSYCAMFPKEFKIEKDMLVRLWMAQSYVIPLEKGQSVNEAAKDYFLVLLQRCFFQDVVKNREGEIKWCKIHDLMHDIALEVSVEKFCEPNSNTNNEINERVRHISVVKPDISKRFLRKSRIRSYIQLHSHGSIDDSLVRNLLANCMRLRTLDLSWSTFKKLPDSIGKLLHLRYLDLSFNGELEVIAKSITKLHNLIFLGINGCGSLKGLPLGMGKLTNLQTLERFKVGYANSSEKQFNDELEDLKSLVHLRGLLGLEIKIPSHGISVKEGEYLNGMQQLDSITIWIDIEREEEDERCISVDLEEELLDKLCPHSNLKYLWLFWYKGSRMPSWGMADQFCTFLPNLVRLRFYECHGLRSLPWLGKLLHLKKLYLENLSNLEYMEDRSNPTLDSTAGSGVGRSPFFPSLEIIKLLDLPKLKSWWSGSPSFPFLPRLNACVIRNCSEMMTTLLFPNDEKRSVEEEEEKYGIPLRSLRHLTLVDEDMEYLPEGIQYLTSLQTLDIGGYPFENKLKCVPSWMPKLTALESLTIRKCSEQFEERCQGPNGEDCHLLHHISKVFIY